jgi:hypothetical protein
MYRRMVRFLAVVVLVWGWAVALGAEVPQGGDEPRPFPSYAEVREVVLRHFALLPDYAPGDMIARSEVEPLFAQLQRMGWKVADRKDILRKVPADQDYLLQKLRTPRGRKFMRRIAGYPDAYDRLDRLSWLPHGRQTVHDLIDGAGGDEMIKYLTTTLGGSELGKMLSKTPKGADFNKPTGRIYTAEMLLGQLEKSHAAEKSAGPSKGAGKD